MRHIQGDLPATYPWTSSTGEGDEGERFLPPPQLHHPCRALRERPLPMPPQVHNVVERSPLSHGERGPGGEGSVPPPPSRSRMPRVSWAISLPGKACTLPSIANAAERARDKTIPKNRPPQIQIRPFIFDFS